MSVSASQNREDELIEVALEMLAEPSTTRVSIPMTLLPMTPEEILVVANVVKAARAARREISSGSWHGQEADLCQHIVMNLGAALAGLDGLSEKQL